jgi:hypothetical protein
MVVLNKKRGYFKLINIILNYYACQKKKISKFILKRRSNKETEPHYNNNARIKN